LKLGDAFPEELKEILKADRFVADLVPNEEVRMILRVDSKRLQETRDKKLFLLLTLTDKTGSIRAVDWHNAELNDRRIRVGNVIEVRGKVVFFDNRLQIVVAQDEEAIRVVEMDEIDSSKFVQESPYDVEKMFSQLNGYAMKVRNEHLKKLLREFFGDREFIEKLKSFPAGVKVHHAYKGGLLEHTLSVVRIVDSVCRIYDDLDRDLLITGAILHDIGKLEDYTLAPTGIEMTDRGQLVGHIVSGVEMLRDRVRKLKGFPERLLMELEHMIISHHGELEFGSPIVPKTKEALALYFADDLDAKMAQFRKIENVVEDSVWSEYDKFLQRRIYIRREKKNG